MDVCAPIIMAGFAVLLGLLWTFMHHHVNNPSEHEPPDWEELIAVIEEQYRQDPLSW